MSTPTEYLDLAARCKAAAEATSEDFQFETLRDMANTYLILWKSSSALETSTEIVKQMNKLIRSRRLLFQAPRAARRMD